MKFRRLAIVSMFLFLCAFLCGVLVLHTILENFVMFSTIAAKAAGVTAGPTFPVTVKLIIATCGGITFFAIGEYLSSIYKKLRKKYERNTQNTITITNSKKSRELLEKKCV